MLLRPHKGAVRIKKQTALFRSGAEHGILPPKVFFDEEKKIVLRAGDEKGIIKKQ